MQHYLPVAGGAFSFRSIVLASWVLGPQNSKMFLWYSKNRVNFKLTFFNDNYTFNNVFKFYEVLYVCFKGIILADWSGKENFHPLIYHIYISKILLFKTIYLR